jgi:outer membrane autotransporter protein
MKKIIATLALMGIVFAAQAVEVGVNTSRDTANTDRNGFGVTVGQKFGAMGVTAGFDRYTNGTDLDKYSVVGSYDVTKIGSATLAVKAGAAYLNPKTGNDGYAALVGAGVSVPLTPKVSATVDYRYQAGQSRINSLDGSTISAGLKYAF